MECWLIRRILKWLKLSSTICEHLCIINPCYKTGEVLSLFLQQWNTNNFHLWMGFPLTLQGVFYTAKVFLDFLYAYNCVGKKAESIIWKDWCQKKLNNSISSSYFVLFLYKSWKLKLVNMHLKMPSANFIVCRMDWENQQGFGLHSLFLINTFLLLE